MPSTKNPPMIFQLVNILTHYHICTIIFFKLCSCSYRQVYFETYKVNFSLYRHFNSCKASSTGRNFPLIHRPIKARSMAPRGAPLLATTFFQDFYEHVVSSSAPSFSECAETRKCTTGRRRTKKRRKRDGFLLRLLFFPHGYHGGREEEGEGSGHGSLGLSVPFPAPKVRPHFRGVSASTYSPGDS